MNIDNNYFIHVFSLPLPIPPSIPAHPQPQAREKERMKKKKIPNKKTSFIHKNTRMYIICNQTKDEKNNSFSFCFKQK